MKIFIFFLYRDKPIAKLVKIFLKKIFIFFLKQKFNNLAKWLKKKSNQFIENLLTRYFYRKIFSIFIYIYAAHSQWLMMMMIIIDDGDDYGQCFDCDPMFFLCLCVCVCRSNETIDLLFSPSFFFDVFQKMCWYLNNDGDHLFFWINN